ncbi:DUF6588 family protein [Alkaliflexus imshenetskii]|uniref:DUF6588 family protein n=1 Tax=Alkaliflexus imshenetskii TaxID=286730 RepID=UPI00047E57E0|nr:DUF6588 family protein [Alkaliflexus imshenetskii]
MDLLKRLILLVLISGLVLPAVNAQKSVTDFLDMGKEDARIMSEAYLRPYGEMLGNTLNGGWYNSARVHRVGGFSLTMGVNMAMVPSSGKNFDVAPLLNQMQGGWTLKDANNHLAPTVAGKMPASVRPVLQQGNQDVLTLPDGSGFDKFPMPMAQVSVGLPFRSEISMRLVPSISAGDAGKVNLIGFGFKHSVKEYLPVIKHMPLVHSSVLVGYTHLGSEVNVTPNADFAGSNQKLEINSNGFTSRFLLGVNIPVIALYTGVGYGSTNSDFDLTGNYGSLGNNPFSLAYKTSGFDFNAGMRLRLGILAIFGDYTFGDYSMATLGVGLSFR